jgi:HPt (histidine-containing phosphotransfer) domain-containing protein
MENLRAAIGLSGVSELVGLFIKDGRQALAGIDRAYSEHDGDALRRFLTDLAGISAMMSAHELADTCRDLAVEGPARLAPRIADLQQEWNRVEWLLAAWARRHGPDTRPVRTVQTWPH